MSRTINIKCWRCGSNNPDQPLPVPRAASCDSCNADLHVCCQCEYFDKSKANACAEPIADVVQQKERANFCDHFSPSPDAYQPESTSEQDKARAGLNALFGISDDGIARQPGESKSDAARRELESLFDLPKTDKQD